MKKTLKNLLGRLGWMAVIAGSVHNICSQDILVKPARGGGLNTNAPMIHVDVFYDYAANVMHATLDTSQGIAKLAPLPPGYAFDSRSNYFGLSGKAYNFQYAWNPGGIFTPPAGAAVWIERLNASPGLEVYDGPGNKTENPPRPYTPIFGAGGSAMIWKWYGRMAHNACAILNPRTNMVSAEYRIYFGDAQTGARDAYTNYRDTTVTLVWTVDPVPGQDLVVTPARGGGLDTNAPMIHADIFYDFAAKEMRATLATNQAVPKLVPLPPGYAFNSRSNYYLLAGKAYNFQYAWNPGGVFTPPNGAAVWIELLSASPGLEIYDGPGNKMESPSRPYTPIFGTGGSAMKWKWYGRMAHNACAILNPRGDVLSADFRIYFADAETGARDAYTNYRDTTIRLTWTVDPVPEPAIYRIGTAGQTEAARLCLLDADPYLAGSNYVIHLRRSSADSNSSPFESCLPLVAVAATAANGGPDINHAALGSCVDVQLVSLAGPPGARLSLREAGAVLPRFSLSTGEIAGTNCCPISVNRGAPGSDPYGYNPGRQFAVDQPGLYCLGIRLVDTSTNGPNGGPIHPSSELYRVYLQAGLTLASVNRQDQTVTAAFGGETGWTYFLEHTPGLELPVTWQTVAGPVSGANRIHTLFDATATNGLGFYRLRAVAP